MKLAWTLVWILLSTQAALAYPPVPVTCKMVDLEFTARLLGAAPGKPQFDNTIICAGVCPSLNPVPGCVFDIGNLPDTGRATGLSIGLGLAPFRRGRWYVGDRYENGFDEKHFGKNVSESAEVPWRGGAALWYYRRSDAYVSLPSISVRIMVAAN